MVQDRARVTTANWYRVVYNLSIGAIFGDLNDPEARFQGHDNIRRWISV